MSLASRSFTQGIEMNFLSASHCPQTKIYDNESGFDIDNSFSLTLDYTINPYISVLIKKRLNE
jgi:hypothetical protein